MLNFQRTIIFCVLFAAVWVQSSNAAPIDPMARRLIKFLKFYMIRAKDRNLIPQDGIDHTKSMKYWDDILDEKKAAIAVKFKAKWDELEKSNSGLEGELYQDAVAKLAYEEWDAYVKDEFKEIEKDFAYDPSIVQDMKDKLKNGHFLEYLASAEDSRMYLAHKRQKVGASTSRK